MLEGQVALLVSLLEAWRKPGAGELGSPPIPSPAPDLGTAGS